MAPRSSQTLCSGALSSPASDALTELTIIGVLKDSPFVVGGTTAPCTVTAVGGTVTVDGGTPSAMTFPPQAGVVDGAVVVGGGGAEAAALEADVGKTPAAGVAVVLVADERVAGRPLRRLVAAVSVTAAGAAGRLLERGIIKMSVRKGPPKQGHSNIRQKTPARTPSPNNEQTETEQGTNC